MWGEASTFPFLTHRVSEEMDSRESAKSRTNIQNMKGLKMMKFMLYALIFAASLCARPSQEIEPISSAACAIFEIETTQLSAPNGRIYKIHTAILRDSRDFDSRDSQKSCANLAKNPQKIFYMLDGNAFFPRLLNFIVQNCADFNEIPAIVGIGHDSVLAHDRALRELDFLPTHGNVAFLDFILNHARPFAREKIGAKVGEKIGENAVREAIFGHSFGGIFALYALFFAQDEFDFFIAASPSLWWDEGRFFVHWAQDFHLQKRVLFTRGSLEKMRGNSQITLESLISRLKNAKSLESAESLKNAESAARIDFVEFPNETHGSSVIFALKEALLRF